MGRKFGPLLMAVAATLLWFSSQTTWITATVEDDKAGTGELAVQGSTWSLELTAIALLFLAGVIAGLALRRTARRIVGAVVALAAIGVSWRPMAALTSQVALARLQMLLQAQQSNDNAVESVAISSWAVVRDATVSPLGPVLALIAAAFGLVGGILLAMRPGADGVRSTKYETKAARAEKLEEELETAPDSGRVMWDALDEDIDPTDPTGHR
ncbi:TIGR02234 family membrane protein [Corynebacterium phoceense]|uniref:TIGR02234 family membrane protein n=1 Tax=Corynebacterium phoceense TaxID=1686286 RepID=UPI00211CFA97|nr:TIGR02234 family membrane protein [Corynebacterium phoceense]